RCFRVRQCAITEAPLCSNLWVRVPSSHGLSSLSLADTWLRSSGSWSNGSCAGRCEGSLPSSAAGARGSAANSSTEEIAMATIEVEFLFTLEMNIEDSNQVIGAIPQGARAIGSVNGTFSGPGIKGAIRACDWFLTRADGIGEADVRGILKTD